LCRVLSHSCSCSALVAQVVLLRTGQHSLTGIHKTLTVALAIMSAFELGDSRALIDNTLPGDLSRLLGINRMWKRGAKVTRRELEDNISRLHASCQVRIGGACLPVPPSRTSCDSRTQATFQNGVRRSAQTTEASLQEHEQKQRELSEQLDKAIADMNRVRRFSCLCMHARSAQTVSSRTCCPRSLHPHVPRNTSS
jgi:hypothetical protein